MAAVEQDGRTGQRDDERQQLRFRDEGAPTIAPAAIAAAKFVRRRDSGGVLIEPNDSGFGAHAPEPGSAMLLALGVLSLLGYRGRCALLS